MWMSFGVHPTEFTRASQFNAATEVAIEVVFLGLFKMNYNRFVAVLNVELGLIQIEVLDIEVALKSTLSLADGAAIDGDCVVL